VKRFLVPLAILLSCVLIITGCSTSATTTTAPATTTAAPTSSTTGPTSAAPSTTTGSGPTATAKPSSTPTASPTATSSSINTGGTLRFITNQSPGTPIGWNAEATGASVFTMQVCLQFMLKEIKGGAFTPNLATSYDVVTDPANPSLTFHLRQGVKFQDGTDFNAKVAKWNFDWTKASGIYASSTNYWKSVDVVDDYTVKINLTMYQNRMLRVFADGVGFMVSPTAYDKNGVDWMRTHMVGTGAFTQTDYQKDVSLTAVRNANYYEQGKPYLDKVQLLYVSDELTRLALFKSGGGEVLDTAGNGRVTNDLSNAGYKIIDRPGGAVVLCPDSINADSPWSNQKVRQAAEYAIDKESIAKTFGYGYWQAAYQMVSPISSAYDPNLTPRKYDVAKAKQLLTDAGFPTGFKTTIIYQIGTDQNIPVAIQSYFSKVGILADLQPVDAVKYSSYITGTWRNAVLINPLQEWANPNNAFNFFLGVPATFLGNVVKRPDGWKEALLTSLGTANAEKANVLKLEDMEYDDVMLIPVYYSSSDWAVTNNVQDSGLGTRGANTWWEPQQTWLSK
jgi:peptide/nickel transport system substrate-binding protein